MTTTTDDLDAHLTDENLRRLWPRRSDFFRMPRGNPGAPGSLTRRHWNARARELEEVHRAFLNGKLSFRDAVQAALQAHLELEQYRDAHGWGEGLERRSLLLLASPKGARRTR